MAIGQPDYYLPSQSRFGSKGMAEWFTRNRHSLDVAAGVEQSLVELDIDSALYDFYFTYLLLSAKEPGAMQLLLYSSEDLDKKIFGDTNIEINGDVFMFCDHTAPGPYTFKVKNISTWANEYWFTVIYYKIRNLKRYEFHP